MEVSQGPLVIGHHDILGDQLTQGAFDQSSKTAFNQQNANVGMGYTAGTGIIEPIVKSHLD